jgi:dihydrofolate synthase/folylpolyglutamate synthase
MSYKTAVARMYALGHELTQAPSLKFDLAHMRALLAALNHPAARVPGILIAGTNGKGSTAATLASILRASGLRTGLYSSPHLVRMNERIRIDGAEISDDDFALLHDVVDRTAERLVDEGELPWHPSFFEMLTAIALEYFAQNKVQIAVLEVGMGGRLDATNVIEPLLSVITDISLDHQAFLGNTVEEIAREKAGIIRPGGVVVTLPQQRQVNDVIGNTILELAAQGVSAVPYVPPVSPGSEEYFGRSREQTFETAAERGNVSCGSRTEADPNRVSEIGPTLVSRYRLEVMGREILVESPLVGRHQLRNIALAIAAAEVLSHQGFPITPEAIERGLRETRWPGRFQVIPAAGEAPEFVFDVAHNPAGAWALRSALSAYYEDRPLTFVFGAMRDKAIGEIAEILFPLALAVIATRADNPRSASADEIREAAARTATDIQDAIDVASALDRARVIAGPQGIVVITGSIYIVGEAMRILGIKV